MTRQFAAYMANKHGVIGGERRKKPTIPSALPPVSAIDVPDLQMFGGLEEMYDRGLINEVVTEDFVGGSSAVNIDRCDSKNPLAVVEYVDEIYSYYKRVEVTGCANPDYMSTQLDINEKMRAILVDWLIDLHYEFGLMEETLYLAVNTMDRFLARQTVDRKTLQLVGVTAMLLACKYEEVSAPAVEDMILISDQAYTREEVLDMLELLSYYIIELCLVEYRMLEFRPSLLAAAAIYTAQCSLKGFKCWTKTSELYTAYTDDQLMECSRMMVHFHLNAGAGKLTAVHRKYNTFKFGFAAASKPALFLLDTRL